MANFLWGKVYFKDIFAGYLREEPGERVSFAYDSSYINANHPAIAFNLPLQAEPHISNNSLHPFFDNLVAEGWLEQAQSRLLGKRIVKRFELLLAFGFDCAGAVSIIDPEPEKLTDIIFAQDESKEATLLTNRASLSGVQPKLTIIKENGQYRATCSSELSTHIAKFSSANHPNLLENEYLTMQAFGSLLPDDDIIECNIDEIKGLSEQALLIKRFDRVIPSDIKQENTVQPIRLHFEEFNQLLNYRSANKYNGSYKDIANFIKTEKSCLPTQNYTLYLRVLAGLLLGNTDMHFKNFAMFHTDAGLRFTPSYDQVAATLYQYKNVALAIAGSEELPLSNLKPNNIIKLGEEFGLSAISIKMAVESLGNNLEKTQQVIAEAKFGSETLKNSLINLMVKRWNGTFALIGKILSKKQ